MADLTLIYPSLFLMGYSLFLSFFMFQQRFRYVRSGKVDPRFFKTYHDTKEVPKEILATARNFSNQFEIPVIFYSLTAFYILLGRVDETAVNLAWAFVITRLIHSFIHISFNKIYPRLFSFTAGIIIIAIMMIKLVV